MHSVTAATIAAGGGAARGRGAARGWRPARRSARSRSASAAPARTSTRPSCRPCARTAACAIVGRKSFVTSGGHADVYLVLVQGEARGDRRRVSRRAATQPGVRLRRRVGGPRDGRQLERRAGARRTSRSATTRASARPAGGSASSSASSRRSSWSASRPSTSASRPPRRRPRRRTRATRRYPDGIVAGRDPVRSSTCSPTWTSRCARRGCSCARRRALGEAGDESALVAIMEAKVAATEAAAAVTQKALEVDRRSGLHARAADRAAPARRARRRGDGADERRPAQLDRQGARRPSGAMSSRDEPSSSARSPTTRGSSRSGSGFRDVLRRAPACRPTTSSTRTTSGSSTRCSPARSTSPGTRTPRTSPREQRIGGDAQLLGMRDVDADFRDGDRDAPRRERSTTPAALAGQRLALGSRDSGHAAILPLHYLAREGLDAERECELVRFDTDLGKHGDTGDSELRVVRGGREGDADAGALGDATWARSAPRARRGRAELEVALAQPDLLPLQLHRAARVRRGAGGAVERGAARDELRRSGAAPGDGPRGREALAAGRQVRLRGPDARRCGSRATWRDASRRVDAGTLELGGGLEVLVARRARERAGRRRARGRRRRRAPSALELPGLGADRRARARRRATSTRPGARALRRAHAARRAARVLAEPLPAARRPLAARRPTASCTPRELRAASRRPRDADPTPASCRSARSPRPGATALRTGALSERDRALGRRARRRSTEQAAAAQWDATRDIPWEAAARAARRRRAGGRPGDDLHRPERVRRAATCRRASCRRSTRATPRC